MGRWLRNPILHFVILGGLLFAVRQGWQTLDGAGASGRAPIVISAEQVRRLQADFVRQMGVPPTGEQLRALIQQVVDDELLYREARQLRLDFQDRSIRMRLVQKMRAVSAAPAQDEEALYREAVRLGLDDDLVVKRVLRQKMRLLLQQDPQPAALQEQDIRDYLVRHRERFVRPEAVTFSHVFLSARVQGDHLDEAAQAALSQLLSQSTPPEAIAALSDPFPLGLQLRFQSRGVIARYFGADFADQVFNAPLGEWAGPITSPFGLHLVRVDEKTPEQMPPLDVVWQQIAGEIQQERATERFVKELRRLRSLYDIRIEASGSAIAQDALEKKQS
jgi:parvulin-like peptidyl-prolyl cis-trans isomerase-like protein